ncbi:MAG TPA: hypothetical protein VH816_04605 [Gaiellaceae bacterium]|jgi:hypothetical protein
MATLTVHPRPTPEERADAPVDVQVDDVAMIHAAMLEDWVTPRQSWALELREGHEFGRANNVEAHLLFVSGEQTSSLLFRLDQLDRADDTGQELVLRFEERDGIAKLVRCSSTGLAVELHHILTTT